MMKLNSILLILGLIVVSNFHGQSKKELRQSIASLQSDTAKLATENKILNDSLQIVKWKLNNEIGLNKQLEYRNDKNKTALNQEINHLSILLEKFYNNSHDLGDLKQNKSKNQKVYFGEKDKFQGYKYTGEGVEARPDNILVPDGEQRLLLNEIDLSEFAGSVDQHLIYDVHVNTDGSVVKLWCYELGCTIQNKLLLTLIGKEIIRQAKYAKYKTDNKVIAETPFGDSSYHPGHLVRLRLFIPKAKL